MLPNANHSPTGFAQSGVRVSIAADVAIELRPPPVGVPRGRRAVLRARVPEAAVEVDGNPSPRKHQVSAPPKTNDRRAIDPVPKSQGMHRSTERKLRLGVSSSL